ncbi:MAG: FxSxx-COOH system tetratricopeptide repeat protein [Chloroflexota bacterium]|nr:FxSxx-COOH system tetratricopeptide repeat protein [Chloroflexota bacterium]
MADTATGPVEIFYSCAPEDEPLQQELANALGLLRRQGRIREWSSRDILGGDERQQMVLAHLEAAHVILLLISDNFINSDQCYKIELPRALARQEAGARVIPILLRPVVGREGTRFAALQPIPRNGKAVTSWPNKDEAFEEVARDISAAIEQVARAALSPSTGTSHRGRASTSGVRDAHDDRSHLWNIPYPQNPFFTGRDTTLKQVHSALRAGKATAVTQPQAFSGLGGIGKTQIAVEYAYRYRAGYQAVLWARADSREALVSGFTDIARLLNLPEKDAQNQDIIVSAVTRWLATNKGWLLILDNADDLTIVRDTLPREQPGHILITTRASAVGKIARRVEIDTLPQEEAALFLLRRAGIIGRNAAASKATAENYTKAKEIAEALDGLPLALEQAGAYIEETGCGLAGYLDRYWKRQGELLQWLGTLTNDYPRPVATTWELSFQKIEEANPTAARILCCCAFLHPDEIPEELLLEDLSDKEPPLEPIAADEFELDIAIAELLKYSLVERDPMTKMLSMHRLVQVALKSRMDDGTQRQWVERVVRVLAHIFPDVGDYKTWPLCERYILHAQACLESTEQWDVATQETARLFNQSGYYLNERGQYTQALPLYQRALAIHERVLGHEHPDTARSLNNLAELYRTQGNYEQALPLSQRALALYEQVLGSQHPSTATSLNNLALLYYAQENYEEALSLSQQALAIRERVLGPDHPDTATSLNNLAGFHKNQGNYEKALPLYQRALVIRERVLGPDHPDTACSLHNLSGLYFAQGNYEEALPLSRRALTICEKALGPDHPNTVLVQKNYDILQQAIQNKKSASPEDSPQ